MELIYIAPVIIAIILIYIFLVKDNSLFRINLNKLYKKHYRLKNLDSNIPELKCSFDAFKVLNSELFATVCYLLEEKNELKEQIENYKIEIKEIKEEIEKIKSELLIAKDSNLQLRKEINILKEA